MESRGIDEGVESCSHQQFDQKSATLNDFRNRRCIGANPDASTISFNNANAFSLWFPRPPLFPDDSLRPIQRENVAGAGLAEIRTSHGLLNFWVKWNWRAAEQAYRQALALSSGYALAHLALANVLSDTARHGDATEEMRIAREVDLLDPTMHAISSQLAFHANDYSTAAEHARVAQRIDP